MDFAIAAGIIGILSIGQCSKEYHVHSAKQTQRIRMNVRFGECEVEHTMNSFIPVQPAFGRRTA